MRTRRAARSTREVPDTRHGSVRGHPEHPAECSRVGRRAHAETERPDPEASGLAQRPTGVGLAVGTLVTVVVGETVREHHEQPSRGAGFSLEHRGPVPDRRTETGVGGGDEPAEAQHHPRVELLAEAFHGCDLHGGSALRPESVERDAIAHARAGRCRAPRQRLVGARAPVHRLRSASPADPETSSNRSTDRSRRRLNASM